ncbi:hypothetical protein N9L19_00500 [bacterium]|nr:hypothetical protein [bacterium]
MIAMTRTRITIKTKKKNQTNIKTIGNIKKTIMMQIIMKNNNDDIDNDNNQPTHPWPSVLEGPANH